MKNPLWKEPSVGRTLGIVGDVYRFLVTGNESDGEYALFEAIVAPGAGPPPHTHTREVESFYVIDGEVTFTLGGEQKTGSAGTFVSVPIGMLHTFTNASDQPAKMLIRVTPAGLERMFAECGVELSEGTTVAPPPTQREIEKLLQLAPQYGVEIQVPETD
jgi:quercetin dioxygenase-like cupin family protein